MYLNRLEDRHRLKVFSDTFSTYSKRKKSVQWVIGDEQHHLMHCTSPGLIKLRIDYFNKIKELKLLIMNKPDYFLNIKKSDKKDSIK